MPTNKDVLDAFDKLGGTAIPSMALKKALENAGWRGSNVAEAINATIAAGLLVMTPMGSLRKP